MSKVYGGSVMVPVYGSIGILLLMWGLVAVPLGIGMLPVFESREHMQTVWLLPTGIVSGFLGLAIFRYLLNGECAE